MADLPSFHETFRECLHQSHNLESETTLLLTRVAFSTKPRASEAASIPMAIPDVREKSRILSFSREKPIHQQDNIVSGGALVTETIVP